MGIIKNKPRKLQNYTRMKFASTLLFAAVLSSDVLAQSGGRGGRDGRDGGSRREPATKAQCVINMDDPDTLDFRGSAVFKQRQRFNGDGEPLASFGGKTFALDPAGESTTAGFNGR